MKDQIKLDRMVLSSSTLPGYRAVWEPAESELTIEHGDDDLWEPVEVVQVERLGSKYTIMIAQSRLQKIYDSF